MIERSKEMRIGGGMAEMVWDISAVLELIFTGKTRAVPAWVWGITSIRAPWLREGTRHRYTPELAVTISNYSSQPQGCTSGDSPAIVNVNWSYSLQGCSKTPRWRQAWVPLRKNCDVNASETWFNRDKTSPTKYCSVQNYYCRRECKERPVDLTIHTGTAFGWHSAPRKPQWR